MNSHNAILTMPFMHGELRACGLTLALALVATAPADALTVDRTSRPAVVTFYRTAYLSSEGVPAGFTGDIASCQPGTISPAYQNTGLTRLLYFRAMAGLTTDVVLSPAWNSESQSAALMMTANQKLSHAPPSTWTCYTATGADAASKSNLAAGFPSLPSAIDGLMLDTGLLTLGHRRWFLYPPEETMGLGATPGVPYPAYVIWVIGGTGSRPATPEWVGWPGPGYFPYQFLPNFWSFSYPGASFTGSTVSMTLDGAPMAVTLQTVYDGYGDNTLVWAPQGLSFAAPDHDVALHVVVSNVMVNGTPRNFAYDVFVMDPNATVAVGGAPEATPRVRLLPNAPNPFSGTTTIRYELMADSDVHVSVYDLAGRAVADLVHVRQIAGKYAVTWDALGTGGRPASPGLYFCVLKTNRGSDRRQLLLVRR